jgi:hypothetical protein
MFICCRGVVDTQIDLEGSLSHRPARPALSFLADTVARGIALYGGFGEVPNVGPKKMQKPKNFMAFEGLRHHLNFL